jgi:two-component system, cell cycle response regulator
LREFGTRIRRDTRGIDLACRLGGEEFVVVMPDCDLAKAYQASACANASRRLLLT